MIHNDCSCDMCTEDKYKPMKTKLGGVIEHTPELAYRVISFLKIEERAKHFRFNKVTSSMVRDILNKNARKAVEVSKELDKLYGMSGESMFPNQQVMDKMMSAEMKIAEGTNISVNKNSMPINFLCKMHEVKIRDMLVKKEALLKRKRDYHMLRQTDIEANLYNNKPLSNKLTDEEYNNYLDSFKPKNNLA